MGKREAEGDLGAISYKCHPAIHYNTQAGGNNGEFTPLSVHVMLFSDIWHLMIMTAEYFTVFTL